MLSRLFGGGNKKLGDDGEELAARHLTRDGYRILERNFRTPMGELDIIAMDGPTLVFIEVKTRRNSSYGSPHDAVDATKQRRMEKAAMAYIAKKGADNAPCRFDVVGVTARPGCAPEVEVIKDAFELSGGYQ